MAQPKVPWWEEIMARQADPSKPPLVIMPWRLHKVDLPGPGFHLEPGAYEFLVLPTTYRLSLGDDKIPP